MIIWLASYPRSGNTLVRLVLRAVFDQHSYSKHDDTHDIGADPRLMEQVGHRFLPAEWAVAGPQLLSDSQLHLVKTHDPPDDDRKAIYIVRDGRSACVSFHRYLDQFPTARANVPLLDVIAGFTPFGSWGEHLDRWNPLHRPNTLLLKYEDLLDSPESEIRKIADFTGLKSLHPWANAFDELSKLNPRFFRAGRNELASNHFSDAEQILFWHQHGDWMRRLGYPFENVDAETARVVERQWLSDRGREHYNLQERVAIAETRVTDLHTLLRLQPKAVAQEREQQLAIRTLEHERAARLRLLNTLRAARRQIREQEKRLIAPGPAELQAAALSGQVQALRDQQVQSQARVEHLKLALHLAQKEYAQSLQQRNKTVDLLGAAVMEQHKRLAMLLTSRLLRAGWRAGLGGTPYWADPKQDELTPLIEPLQRRPHSKALTLDSIRNITAIANRTTPSGNDMEAALDHLLEKGFRPGVVLDVGSAKGYWSVITALRWPAAEYFMIDPLAASEPELTRLCQNPKFHYLLMAVGDEPTQMTMQVAEEPDSSSLLNDTDTTPARQQKVVVETIDRLLESGQIKPPQLVKMDVQGFELRALTGGQKLFQSAEVFIIECNLFEFMPGFPRMHELIRFMADHGYFPFDFAGFLRRPFENDLGQVDLVFVRQDHPMVSSNRWVGSQKLPENAPPAEPADSLLHIPPTSGPVEVNADAPKISVIICTRNPRWDILDRTLDAIARQTLGSGRFELIIVDNGSQPPLDLKQVKGDRAINPRLISEPVSGLSNARCTAIANATGALLVFVDDDNILADDYLEQSLQIALTHPRVGLFGGISRIEMEKPIPKWKQAVLPYLGIRDHGDEAITAYADHWGEWEPIGAGMVARREVAERFVAIHKECAAARQLGRNGTALLSGEDSLFARAAYRVGYSCSYQPALNLIHYIKASRLKTRYLIRLLEGHGRSFVILQRSVGKPVDPLPLRTAFARLFHRVRSAGRAGLITWFWDLGYAREYSTAEESLPEQIPRPSIIGHVAVGEHSHQ